jgi:hypothetical protein
MSKVPIIFKPNENLYSDDLDSWALLKVPDDKGVIGGVLVSPMHCREEFLGDVISGVMYAKDKGPMKQALIGKNGWSYFLVAIGVYAEELVSEREKDNVYGSKAKVYGSWNAKMEAKIIELEKKAALIEHNKRHKRLRNAIKFLNHFESIAKWRRSSLLLGPATHETPSNKSWYENAYWIFQINSKWCNSTYMLSMLILIIRTGLYFTPESIKRYINGKSWEKVEIKDNVSSHMDLPWELEENVRGTARYWIKILKNYNDLFPVDKEDPLSYWKNARYEEGIYCLVESDVDDFDITDRMTLLDRKGKIDKKELKKMAAARDAEEDDECW